MDKPSKVFLDSFILGIACGAQRCLEVLSHSTADRNNNTSSRVPGELQKFLEVIAEVLNSFGDKLNDETDVHPLRSLLEMNSTSSEKSPKATDVTQQMTGVFNELVQAFRQLISTHSAIKLQSSDTSANAKPSEKTSLTDISRELCQVLQEMGEILTQIVDSVKADENTTHSSPSHVVNRQSSVKKEEATGNSSSRTGEETVTKTFEDNNKERIVGTAIVRTDNDDGTREETDDGQQYNYEEDVESKVDESRNHMGQEEVERNFIGPLLEGQNSVHHTCIKGVGEEDTTEEATTAEEYDSSLLTEDEDITPEVSKRKELLELSAVRMFREHIERDGLEVEIFRTPHDQPSKYPSYTCRLLGMEAVACGRSKRAAKRNALCNMIHLLVKKHEDGCLPNEVSPFTNEEIWALEEVCLGGDDYLTKLRRLCDLEDAPPPVFYVQKPKGSLGDKMFTVKCSALGRTAVGTCPRKRSAKRHAAREIVKQYEREAAATGEQTSGVQLELIIPESVLEHV